MNNRKRLGVAILISLCLFVTNHLGLATLTGTGPSDTFAPLFVFGVGAFWTQFLLLGMFAGLLPMPLHWRVIFPILLTLALCAEIRLFTKYAEGISLVGVVGFVASWGYFQISRTLYGLRLQNVEQDVSKLDELSPRSSARFGIGDIFTMTFLVALLMMVYRLDAMRNATDALILVLATTLSYLLVFLFTAPLNVVILAMRRQLKLGALGLVLILIVLPTGVSVITQQSTMFRTPHWPFLYCLCFGVEGAWLSCLGCIRLLGYRFVMPSAR